MLQVCLRAGVCVRVCVRGGGGKALHLAARMGFEPVVVLLLGRGAPAAAKNAMGQTPKDGALDAAISGLFK